MHLPQKDINLFFKLHPVLLQYVNENLNLIPHIHTPRDLQHSGLQNVAHVREKLWERPQFIDEFILDNPYAFPDKELAIVREWKSVIRGPFYIVRHLKKYSVFMTAKGRPIAYGVCSLFSPISDMTPYVPLYVDAALILFKGRITYDGVIMLPYSIVFGRGYEFDIEERYRKARKSLGIVSTLNEAASNL